MKELLHDDDVREEGREEGRLEGREEGESQLVKYNKPHRMDTIRRRAP